MSDKPNDTPFDQFTNEEKDAMSNDELMDRSIALDEFGIDGFLDSIVREGTARIGMIVLQGQVLATQVEGMEEARQLGFEMSSTVSQILSGVAETARRLGQREERGDFS